MRILIDNSSYNLMNHGDFAMLVSTAKKIKEIDPNSDIRILTDAPAELNKIIPHAKPVSPKGRKQWQVGWNIIGALHKFFPSKYHNWLEFQERKFIIKYPDFSRRWISRRLSRRGYALSHMHDFLDEVKAADIVISSGGGFVTDSFLNHASSLLQTLALAQSYGKPTAMFGQGLGPVTDNKLLSWSKFVLPRLERLSLREGLYSKPFAISIGVPEDKINVTGDDAITMTNSKKPIMLGDAIGINIRIASYSGMDKNDLAGIKEKLDACNKRIGTQLCGIPISYNDDDSDMQSLHYFLSTKMASEAESLSTPDKIIEQVKKCRIVVTGSYHGGVFSLSQGVSVVAIVSSDYYRQKFEGLQSQFGVGCTIVDRNSSAFHADLEAAIYKSYNAAESVRVTLLNKAEEQAMLSELSYRVFFMRAHVKGNTFQGRY